MGKYTAFQIPLKSLTPGVHHYDYRLDKVFFENMESSDIRDAALDVSLDVEYTNDVYRLSFFIDGEVTVQCDRCLDEMQLPIETGYVITVKYGDAYRDDSDDVLEIPESTNDLNVAYMIYDTVSLAVPIKHVHPLGKCNRQMSAVLKKHRVTTNGEDNDLENQLIDEMDSMPDAGTDPRWDALKDFPADGGGE